MRELSPIQGLVDRYKQSPRPVDRFIAKSIEEIFSSGKFRSASISPEFKDGHPIQESNALVMVSIRGEKLQGTLQIIDFREDLVQSRSQSIERVVEDEWETFPELIKGLVEVPERANEIIRLTTAQGLQTLAGIHLSTSVATGQELFEFFYPEFFRHPDMPNAIELSEDDIGDEVGRAIAVHFLRKLRPIWSGKGMRIDD